MPVDRVSVWKDRDEVKRLGTRIYESMRDAGWDPRDIGSLDGEALISDEVGDLSVKKTVRFLSIVSV